VWLTLRTCSTLPASLAHNPQFDERHSEYFLVAPQPMVEV